jgi:hypothetical protein
MTDERLPSEDFEGRGSGLIEVLTRNLPGRPEENEKNLRSR